MSRFNLIDEKWIPVRYPNGERDELGIRDTLLRAKEIATIEDGSPLVVAALHRFLLAVLYRALEGPTDIDQAKVLFRDGLPGEKIVAYLEKWRGRFWLFDDEYPFWQVRGYEPKAWKAWTSIAAEHNADNAKVLFDHVEVAAAGSISRPMAARWLVACQTFALGGGNSDFGYTKHAPSAVAAMVLPVGFNLGDSLLFSLVPENRLVLASDLPIWEREPVPPSSLKTGITRVAMGIADLYTWPSRSIKFRLDESADMLSGLAFASGVESVMDNFIDPMLGYKINEKRGKHPLQFRDRGFWRDFDSLLPDAANLAPQVIQHATALTRSNRGRFPKSVMVLGQANNKAKIEYWRMERFALPAALANDGFVKAEIHQLLSQAENAETVLEKAFRVAAKLILARGGRDLQGDKWSNGKWKPGDVSRFVGKSTIEAVPVPLANYWATLESSFHEVLDAYKVGTDSDDIFCLWLKSIRYSVKAAWEQHRLAVSTGDAWTIRALVKAEGLVERKLKELNEEILKFEPKKEVV